MLSLHVQARSCTDGVVENIVDRSQFLEANWTLLCDLAHFLFMMGA